MTRKEDKKKLRGVDAFQMQLVKGFDWILANKKAMGLILLPVVLVAVGGIAWQYFQEHRTDKRLHALGVVEDVYAQELIEAGKKREALQKEMEALNEAPKAEAKPGEPAAPKTPPAVDAQKIVKRMELEKQINDIKPDHSKSLAQFEAFFKSHESEPEGWMAALRAASILLTQKKTAEARPLVESVAKQSSKYPFYQIQSRFILVGLLEDAGEYDAGIKETEALLAVASDDLKPRVLLTKGRIQMLKDAKGEAKATLDEVINKHGSSPEAQKARSMMALLN